MSEVGIDDSSPGGSPQIVDSQTALFRYQYARVDDNFRNTFDMSDGNIVDSAVEDGDEVFRRIRQTTAELRYPARTAFASVLLLNALRDLPWAGAATRTRKAPGWYDVTTTTFQQTGTWSKWRRVQDLDVET